MQLGCPDLFLCHDVRESFADLLKAALAGRRIGIALGPIYEKDPAEELLFPFIRADVETGWSSTPRYPDGLPQHVIDEVRRLRQDAVSSWERAIVPYGPTNDDLDCLNDWARAGLVLEVARRRGINVKGLGTVHVTWRMKGTVTGRFGASSCPGNAMWPNGFNPLTIPEDKRHLILPSSAGRIICVMDFRAIDLCSMVSIVPGLRERYDDATDMHMRTAELLFGPDESALPELRDLCKSSIFIHAYGGTSSLKDLYEEKIPELTSVRKVPDGQFARTVQRISAEAFRGALSNALPSLLGDDVIPMFVVHDELVLDVGEDQVGACVDIANLLEEGARRAIGSEYFVGPKFGLTYAEAKL